MSTEQRPFQFVTAAYLTRVENQVAYTLRDLRDCLDHASDAAIFYHTFRALSRYHFLTEGFSNDFAQWVLASANRAELSERLAGIDIRDYTSVAELRSDVRRILTDFIEAHPDDATQRGLEPFYFLQAVEVTRPLREAKTLAGFRAGLERITHASFYYHFVASRLRLQLKTNDFSHWFETALGLPELARDAGRIDLYSNTFDTARRELIALVDRNLAA